MRKYLTKKQAIIMFKEIAMSIPSHDKPMLREAWNNYTDSLCKDGEISDRQYSTWSNPY